MMWMMWMDGIKRENGDAEEKLGSNHTRMCLLSLLIL